MRAPDLFFEVRVGDFARAEDLDFAALEELYGTTNYQLNAFAFMAVRQGDTETAQQMFTRIGDNWDADVWGTKDKFERSKTTLSLDRKNDVTDAVR